LGVTVEGWGKIKQAAQYAGVSERTFRPWLQQGLRHVRLKSGTILIKFEWIDQFLEGFESTDDEAQRIADELERSLRE
jgi:excisionase family DNA binding protein